MLSDVMTTRPANRTSRRLVEKTDWTADQRGLLFIVEVDRIDRLPARVLTFRGDRPRLPVSSNHGVLGDRDDATFLVDAARRMGVHAGECHRVTVRAIPGDGAVLPIVVRREHPVSRRAVYIDRVHRGHDARARWEK